MRRSLGLAWLALWFPWYAACWAAGADAEAPDIKVVRVGGDAVELQAGDGGSRTLRRGERMGDWTLMGIAPDGGHVVLEDFTRREGRMLFVDGDGVRLDLGKTAESTAALTPGRYLGYTQAEVKASATDLLGESILATPGDPDYDAVAAVFPPLRKVRLGTYDFVGTPDTADKVNFQYGGRSPNFDPVVLQPSIDEVRKAGKVWNGLVGGHLPVLRFVYPEGDDAWTEMLAFAPFRIVDGNDRIQPVWYRVSRIERGTLKWSRHVDSYMPFPPRAQDDAAHVARFYADLARFKDRWDVLLAPGMQVELPDRRVADMARFGLVRAIMTRVGDFPKYGAVDKDYGGSEHDGFPDTFTVETSAMLDWGLVERAGRYIDNYFSHFVRDDGSLLYRGPETGQYGRMLTVVARYAQVGGDAALLLRHRRRIDAIARLLLSLRETALALPEDDPAHGMIAGWSEADAVLERDPARYMQPYFSNSTEAVRGFRELGAAWQAIGRRTRDDSLAEWGGKLLREADALHADLDTAIARSLLHVDGETILPTIAGAKAPYHVAVQRDPLDPQYRAYRANMEMVHSGVLDEAHVALVLDYRARHHDILLGMPTAYGYNTGEMVGFLSYGHGHGLLQLDRVREALLLLYSDMAHHYTRGSWMAPETRGPMSDADAAPYCTPAQLVASLMTRWLLVFEDPRSDMLWLGKAMPRAWLRDGETVSVSAAPTRWGSVGYRIRSRFAQRRIEATLDLPAGGLAAGTRLRLRAPGEARLRAVTVDGRAWTRFDAAAETIEVPAGTGGRVEVVAHY